MTRREFTLSCLGALAASTLAAGGVFPNRAVAQEAEKLKESTPSPDKTRVAFLLFEGMTALDMVGPATVFGGPDFIVDYVWRDKNPVYSELPSGRMGLLPTATFAEIRKVDILCVPGTSNPYVQITQPDIVEWVAQVGETASWVTSVCTGSLILGAAGLLKGYKATSHWTMIDDLAYFGAIPTHERVVRDRNRMTGAGITSGIDFGLTLFAALYGESAAKEKQLTMEYDPAPPFKGGSPKSAPPEMISEARQGFAAYMQQAAPGARQSLEEAARRLGVPVPR